MTTMRQHLLAAAISGMLAAVASPAVAADPTSGSTARTEAIYGYHMMTPQERDAYREKMRNAANPAERQALRDEHHAAMAERARERGITLPDRPTGAGARGRGMGPGMGSGSRMGPPERQGPGYGPRGPGYGPERSQQ
jgi:hypothetical protein